MAWSIFVTTWPKLFQNLRSTRETELSETYSVHVFCQWIGNSVPVAAKHYLQVTDVHFQQAAQNPAQYLQAERRTTQHESGQTPGIASGCEKVLSAASSKVGPEGFERPPILSGNTAISANGGAESGAVDARNNPLTA